MLDIVYENVTSAPTETIVDLYRAGGWWQEEPAWRASPGAASWAWGA